MSIPSLFGRTSWPLTVVDRDEFLTPFGKLFDDMTRKTFPEFYKELGDGFFEKGSYPKVDIRDEETQIVVEAEVPGLKRDQVTVEVEKDTLKIKGERRFKDDFKDRRYIRQELKRSSFCRTFVLGDNINADKISAKFDDGILSVVLPKLQPSEVKSEVRKIEVK